MAALGVLLSLAGLAGGAAWHYVAYSTELPEGYTRLDFTTDIAEKVAVARTAASATRSAGWRARRSS